jgi:hypothetical protein
MMPLDDDYSCHIGGIRRVAEALEYAIVSEPDSRLNDTLG